MSVYYDILSALKTRITTAVASANPLPTVALRKRAVMLGGDPFPMIVVAPGDGGEVIEVETFNLHVTYSYPAIICLFLAGDRDQTLDTQGYLGLRQTIRDAIYQPLLAGAGTVYDTQMSLGGSFIQVENRSTVELTTFRLSFLSSETRSA
jgi:hypothetical protein